MNGFDGSVVCSECAGDGLIVLGSEHEAGLYPCGACGGSGKWDVPEGTVTEPKPETVERMRGLTKPEACAAVADAMVEEERDAWNQAWQEVAVEQAALEAVAEAARRLAPAPFGAYERWRQDGNAGDADKLEQYEQSMHALAAALAVLDGVEQ